MTARKATLRTRRRTAGATNVPKFIGQWFAGERSFSVLAASWPHRFAIPDYWAAWLTEHPGAVPPPNLRPYLQEQEPTPGSHLAALRAKARQQLGLDGSPGHEE